MSGISLSDLAGIRKTIVSFFPDFATITRTGKTVACRVDAMTTQTHLPGTPRYMQLRRFEITLPSDTDAAEWDIVTVSGTLAGDYLITTITGPTSDDVSDVDQAIQLGASVSAHTLREPGPLLPGVVAAFSTYLTGLKLRPLMGVLVMPVSQQSALDALGIQLQQPAMILAQWPAGYTGENPIIPRDVLVLDTGGTEYQVSGVRPYQGKLIEIYIDLAQEVGS